MAQTGTVVVGIDGSPESRAALDFALAESHRRRAPLRVVAAYVYPEHALGYPYPVLIAPERIAEATREVAQGMIDVALRDSHSRPSDFRPADSRPSVRLVVRAGPAAEVLVAESAGAELLVLGHRCRGAIASALLGSVGLRCLLHATCPVTVVRPSGVTATPAMATTD